MFACELIAFLNAAPQLKVKVKWWKASTWAGARSKKPLPKSVLEIKSVTRQSLLWFDEKVLGKSLQGPQCSALISPETGC